jgi:hypothetical protein
VLATGDDPDTEAPAAGVEVAREEVAGGHRAARVQHVEGLEDALA